MRDCRSARAAERWSLKLSRPVRCRSLLKWLWKAAWTELNFCRLFICLNLSIALSRRRKGWWEFSQRLFAQRPISCFSALPISFIAGHCQTNGRATKYSHFSPNFRLPSVGKSLKKSALATNQRREPD